MNLRSAIITAVYSKSLVISAAGLSKKSTGEITNLMSVDSTRLQELTPYLHAIWYSLYQITIAMYLLWQQVGPACLAGMAVIILGIPLTSRVSLYMKTLQKELSKIRDERIKLTNEVLSGMKVIKLQAWEGEFEKRIIEIRSRELGTFRKYAIAQSIAGVLAISIPLMVAIMTFITFVSLGNTLTVATALTSLALFEVLRFPLFMLPQVINNLIEARVSVERVQSFLMQPERIPVPSQPLRKPGVLLDGATLVWESAILKYKLNQLNNSGQDERPTVFAQMIQPVKDEIRKIVSKISFGHIILFPIPPKVPTTTANLNLSDEEMSLIIKDALLVDSESIIKELEKELKMYRKYNTIDYDDEDESTSPRTPLSQNDSFDSDYLNVQNNRNANPFSNSKKEGDEEYNPLTVSRKSTSNPAEEKRLLTLSRINFSAQKGQLISIIGQVGSGKSSILNSLLGNLRLCLGNVAIYGKVAYAAQLAFIQNSTLKDNILYGKPFDDEKYQKTLEMCALLPDLQVLPAGDLTEIGERGINLSGGQKARVGLARAVYSDADIYLLDDPLSAVDAHVGKHLFEECIMKLKEQNKCILFVTNALHFVKHSTKIYVLKDGHIAESGNFVQLSKRGTLFKDMMNTLQETGNSSLAAGNENDEEHSGEEKKVDSVNLLDKSQSNDETTHKTKKEAKPKADKPPSTGKLITTEDQEVGNVDLRVYIKWATAAGGVAVGAMIIFAFYFAEMVSMLSSWWLSFWSEHQHKGGASPWFYLTIYILINIMIVLVSFIRELYVRLKGLNASRDLFEELLKGVLFAPMSFFDVTPIGRVINRFSKDIYTVRFCYPLSYSSFIIEINLG